jgi:N-carbamoyl-L-amino-acid hydrolase
MQEVVACAHRHPPHGRGTVGMVQVHPNSRNVIPGRVKFSIDLRNASDALCDAMDADIRAVPPAQRRERPADPDRRRSRAYPAQPFHRDCVDAVGRAAAKLGYSTCRQSRAPATTRSTWPASHRPA